MKTDFNRFGQFTMKSDAPSSSWWTDPAVQNNRAEFEKRLVAEEIRMMNLGKFAGHSRTHDKGLREK
jgi:hypothetical protein